ncbi:MAG: hypothetical protein AMXMBFR47_04870 [Planctomycetota bacterium]
MSHLPVWLRLCAALTIAGVSATALADLRPPTLYRFLEGTQISSPVNPAIPLTGRMDLVPDPGGPVPDRYRVIRFRAVGPLQPPLEGAGEYWIGVDPLGNAAHQMILDIESDAGIRHFDSGVVPRLSRFPMIEIRLAEVPGPIDNELIIIAAPIEQVWFSTEMGFHPDTGGYVSEGDLINNGGRVVATNHHLTRNLGIMPIPPDIGLDALLSVEVDTPHGWEQWFSANQDVFSERIGMLYAGDLLSERGDVVRRNADLIAAFQPGPVPRDVGLDAIGNGSCRCLWFSVEQDFWSESLGMMVGHGDLLAEHGEIMARNAKLLEHFQPAHPTVDLGLDAYHYRWDTGEFWFLLRDGFDDMRWGWISDGDLLSDSGWIVYRNLRLVERFHPLEDAANFGLDALHVVPFPEGDVDFDGVVGLGDLAMLLSHFGTIGTARYEDGDLDFDLDVDLSDLARLLANFGSGV